MNQTDIEYAESPPSANSQSSLELILSSLRKEAKRYRVKMYVWLPLFLVVYFFIVSGLFLYDTQAIVLMSLSLVVLVIPTLLALPNRKLRADIRALCQLNDVSAVGPLIDLQRDVLPISIKRELRSQLIKLLPMLREEHAEFINYRQRLDLRTTTIEQRLLWKDRDAFTLATLSALEHIGDSRDLPTIKKLAQGKPETSIEMLIRDRARICYDMVKERVDRLNESVSLLRPANMENNLLMPAGKTETATDALLRPITK